MAPILKMDTILQITFSNSFSCLQKFLYFDLNVIEIRSHGSDYW